MRERKAKLLVGFGYALDAVGFSILIASSFVPGDDRKIILLGVLLLVCGTTFVYIGSTIRRHDHLPPRVRLGIFLLLTQLLICVAVGIFGYVYAMAAVPPWLYCLNVVVLFMVVVGLVLMKRS